MSGLVLLLITFSVIACVFLLGIFIDALSEYQVYGKDIRKNKYHRKLVYSMNFFKRILCNHSWKYSLTGKTCTKCSKEIL